MPADHTFDWDAAWARLLALQSVLESDAPAERTRQREILSKRASLLARVPASDLEPSESIEAVRFSVRGESYALEMRFIREVVRSLSVTVLPGAPPFVLGISNVRGEICPIIGLQALLGFPAERPTGALGLVLGLSVVEFGVLIDEIHELLQIPLEKIHPLVGVSPTVQALCRGATREGWLILDGQALLSDPRLFIEMSA